MLGEKNTPSESPVFPQTNIESPIILETNATAEVSDIFYTVIHTVIFHGVFLDSINCYHIVLNTLLTCHTSID